MAAVAFSPDSRYIASLGTSQDGFLHVWSFNARTGLGKLYSSSKCTSSVRALTWITKDSLITGGTRHVKTWRVEEPRPTSPSKQRFPADGRRQSVPASPGPQLLPGRNCLLGSLADRTFTCATRIPDGGALLCTDKGDVCMVEQTEGNNRLVRLAQTSLSITCVTVHPCGRYAWLGSKTGELQTISLVEIISSRRSCPSPVLHDCPNGISNPCASPVVGIAVVADLLIVTDSKHAPRIFGVVDRDGVAVPGPARLESLAHGGPVMGTSVFERVPKSGAQFLSWTADGQVFCWDGQGSKMDELQVELEQVAPTEDDFNNDLKVMRASPFNDCFVAGDRFGVLRITDGFSRKGIFETKAHGAEITDIKIHQDDKLTLVATGSRDRMVQLYRKTDEGWNLAQTFDEHKATVTAVMFTRDASYLLSCAGDRTIAVRKLVTREGAGESVKVAYVPHRTLILKSAPASMATSSAAPGSQAPAVAAEADTIFVSTAERMVHEYDIQSGQLRSSFRACDTDTSDAAVLDKLVVFKLMDPASSSPEPCVFVAGASSTDKSIRVYDHRGGLVCREWGHTEGITGLARLPGDTTELEGDRGARRTRLVTTGADGTIMLWDFGAAAGVDGSCTENGVFKEMTATKRPLRKALSRTELAQFQRVSNGSPLAHGGDARHAKYGPRISRTKASRPIGVAATNGSHATPIRKATDNDDDGAVSPTSSPSGRMSAPQHTPAPGRYSSKTLPSRASSESQRRHRARSMGNFQAPKFQSYPYSRSSPSSRRHSAVDLVAYTEDLCQTLHGYRERMSSGHAKPSEIDPRLSARLQRELQLTLQALQRHAGANAKVEALTGRSPQGETDNGKSTGLPVQGEQAVRAETSDLASKHPSAAPSDDKVQAFPEDHLVKLLTEYSERLVDAVHEKITSASTSPVKNKTFTESLDGGQTHTPGGTDSRKGSLPGSGVGDAGVDTARTDGAFFSD